MTRSSHEVLGSPRTTPAAATLPPPRDLDAARERADEAVREYARLAAEWNAPDHRHTAYQLRCLVEWAIREEVPNGRKL